jgi:hypothetical protein
MFQLQHHAMPALRNAEAAKPDRIAGAKFQAVKNILSMPDSCRQLILNTVSEFGWEGNLKEICS